MSGTVSLIKTIWLLLQINDTFKLLKHPKIKRRVDHHVISDERTTSAKYRMSTLKREQWRVVIKSWIVWTSFGYVERLVDSTIGSVLPFYSQLKIVFLLCLGLTRSVTLPFFFDTYLQPQLLRYSRPVDLVLSLSQLIIRYISLSLLCWTIIPVLDGVEYLQIKLGFRCEDDGDSTGAGDGEVSFHPEVPGNFVPDTRADLPDVDVGEDTHSAVFEEPRTSIKPSPNSSRSSSPPIAKSPIPPPTTRPPPGIQEPKRKPRKSVIQSLRDYSREQSLSTPRTIREAVKEVRALHRPVLPVMTRHEPKKEEEKENKPAVEGNREHGKKSMEVMKTEATKKIAKSSGTTQKPGAPAAKKAPLSKEPEKEVPTKSNVIIPTKPTTRARIVPSIQETKRARDLGPPTRPPTRNRLNPFVSENDLISESQGTHIPKRTSEEVFLARLGQLSQLNVPHGMDMRAAPNDKPSVIASSVAVAGGSSRAAPNPSYQATETTLKRKSSAIAATQPRAAKSRKLSPAGKFDEVAEPVETNAKALKSCNTTKRPTGRPVTRKRTAIQSLKVDEPGQVEGRTLRSARRKAA